MALTNSERQAAFKQRKAEQGETKREYYLTAAQRVKVDKYAQELKSGEGK